ncbi:hypothetical protein BVRB_8g181380 isoform A [Beta vulgaris subsp. vulgaris]|nr:hypothetical protein BVRB_8g181380 isoform A [Beta vulgaris subsp. vulgaris]
MNMVQASAVPHSEISCLVINVMCLRRVVDNEWPSSIQFQESSSQRHIGKPCRSL